MRNGDKCEIGKIIVGPIPILKTGQSFNLSFVGTPTNSISVHTSYRTDRFNGRNIKTIKKPFKEANSSFTAVGRTGGLYRFEHHLTGEDLKRITYIEPEDTIVLVNDDSVQSFGASLELAIGCCPHKYRFQFSIPSCSEDIKFVSSCAWTEESNRIETDGVVFIQRGDFYLPISIGGLTHNPSNEKFRIQIAGFTKPQCKTCSTCQCLGDTDCVPAIETQDIQYMLSRRVLLSTFLNAMVPFSPKWMSLQVLQSDSEYSVFDYIYFIGSKTDAANIYGCEKLPFPESSLIYIARSSVDMVVQIFLQTSNDIYFNYYKGNDEFPICYAVDMCAGKSSMLHVGIPQSVANFISSSFLSVQMFTNKGWSFNYHYLSFGYLGITIDFYRQEFWNGLKFVTITNSKALYDYQIYTQFNGNLTGDHISAEMEFNGAIMYKLDSNKVNQLNFYFI